MKWKEHFRNALDMYYSTDDGLKYQVIGDEIKITGYKKNVSIQEIPAYINDLPVGVISGLQEIPFNGELIIPNTVHTIADNALNLTKGITKIKLPDSIKSIGTAAFSFSQALEEIFFSDGMDFLDTDPAVIESCSKLRKVHLPSTMKRIPVGFLSSCDILEEIFIPNSVEEIADVAFTYDSKLKNVNLPQSLKVIGELAFCDCVSLHELILPEGLEIIGKSAFSGCTNLTSLIFPSTLKKIEKNAFRDCKSLIRSEIPSHCDVDKKAFD